jgi:hypothetical protein
LFTRNPTTLSVDKIVPLITHTQRLYYDSGSNEHDSGNLAPQAGNKHGVKWNELKPAMRLNRIIEAIEETFPVLEFTDDFFKNTTNEKFNNLFMWLSRKSGAVENLSGAIEVTTRVPFPSGTSQYGFFGSNNGVIYITKAWSEIYSWDYSIVTNGTQPSFTVTVTDDFNQLIYQSSNNTGNLNIFKSDLDAAMSGRVGIYLKLEITSTQQIDFNYISWNGDYQSLSGSSYDFWSRSTGSFLTNADFLFEYSKQMPDMTILNFLSGLFRMFNLTAYVQDDGKIKVQPLDEYYNDNFVYRDITQYVGIEKSSVNAALPYRQVKFDFSDTKSFLANKFGEINNKAWGLLQYNNGQNDLTGSLYKVTAPFGHFLFEKLTDADTNSPKNIQWGWSVDRSRNAMLPKPLLFYPVRPSINTISWVNAVDPENNEAISDVTITPGSLPFNSVSYDATINNFQLNFTQEVSEWTGDTSFTNTLFTPYTKYIISIFNPKQRLTKVEVMLPIAEFLQIQMNDRIIIRNHYYRINSITTNLSTGKSELELLNELN